MRCIKMSLQFWNLKLESKGFIFSLDMVIAMSFTIIMLVLANYYIRTENPLSQLQIEKTGSDIAALLEHKGILDTLNSAVIKENLDKFLPVNDDMRLNITTKNNVRLIIGSNLPENKDIISGKRVFVIAQGSAITDHAKLQYWIWLK